MKTIKYLLCVLLVVMGMATLDSCCYPSPWSEAKEIKQLPEIFPDYIGVTVPVNIAPLNFNMTDDDVDEMLVSVAGSKTIEEISSFGKEYADFDVEEWHDFLRKIRAENSPSQCLC